MKNILVIKYNSEIMDKFAENLSEHYSVNSFTADQLKSEPLEIIYPDLILIFSDKIEENHYQSIRLLKRNYPDVPIILFDEFGFTEKVINSLKIGAVGYFNYKEINSDLNEIILSSFKGEMSIPKLLAEDLVTPNEKYNQINRTFTTKELIFLTLLKDSVSYSLIADKLDITIDKIYFLVRNIYRKLHFYYNVSDVI